MKRASPPSTLRTKGQQFLWLDEEERYMPLIEEGDPSPTPAHYRAAERLTARLHARRHGR